MQRIDRLVPIHAVLPTCQKRFQALNRGAGGPNSRFIPVARLVRERTTKEAKKMEFIAKEKAFEEVTQPKGSQQIGECTRFSQGRFLDELPGAAFVAVTLIWIMSSFAHLIW
jgi:hypothetical protein